MPNDPKYDRQLIVLFLPGPPEEDVVIERGAEALEKKAKRKGAELPCVKIAKVTNLASVPDDVRTELKTGLQKLSEGSRLYLSGHGGYPSQIMGGWTGPEMAALLKACGLTTPVKLISILGCQSARGPSDNMISDSALQSFAAEFHRSLGTVDPCVKCDVYARIYNLGVLNDTNLYGCEKHRIGHKVTEKDHYRDDDAYKQPDWISKQSQSKRRYFWAADDQKWEWVAYGSALFSTPTATKEDLTLLQDIKDLESAFDWLKG